MKTSYPAGKWLLVLILTVYPLYSAAGQTIYVDAGATGANNGTSWADAYKYLRDALTAAGSGSEIWVAQGTYRPDANTRNPTGTNDRTATFQLKNGVAIYGGFPTGGGSRDPNTYVTSLSGDINVPGNNSDNSYHVVTGSGIDSTTVLDGFTITKGYATSSGANFGGGLYNSSGSPTVTNCTFNSNTSINGGGMYNYNSSPTITNCTFTDNEAYEEGLGVGGGIYNNKFSSPTLNYCTFSGNSAYHGGGMFNDQGSPTVTNCTFNSNTSKNDGGGVYNKKSSPTIINCIFSGNEVCFSQGTSYGGGMFNNYSSPTLTNCKFIGNLVDGDGAAGGGMFNYVGSPTLTNCTFIGNSANGYNAGGGGMYNDGSSPNITNCEFSGNSADYYGSGMFNYVGSPTLTNCTFTENEAADFGGGMYNYSNSDPNIVNCTFIGNSVSKFGGGIYNTGSSPNITNCILWGNSAPTGPQIYGSAATVSFSDVQGGWTGTGNINADPRFVSGPGGNYYLSQIASGQAFDSPCVNAGSDTAANLGMDLFTTRTDRVCNVGIVDMGYHYSPFVVTADIDGDGDIDFVDFAILAGDWLKCSNPYDSNCMETGLLAGDIIPDYYVNIYDLEFFVSSWLDCHVEYAWAPEPADNKVDVNTNIVLKWLAGSGATSHDVYFGTTSPGTFQGNQTETTYDPPETLSYNTTYYWRIDEKNACGTTIGMVWRFTTVAPPGKAISPSPANGATDVGVTTDLSWTAGSGATSHIVYFGTTSPGTLQGEQGGTTFDTGTMSTNTTYYWRIDEKNTAGTTTGDVWSFTTWLEPNLVSWWKFDEGSGAIAHDSAGSNHGQLINGPVWTTGQIAGALSFDGINDFVNCGSGPSNYDNITVSAWMKTATKGVLVSNRDAGGSYGTWYSLYSSSIEIGDNSQGGYRGVTFNTPTLNNVWHHIVYTKDGINHAIYVDGSLDQQFTSNADISQNSPLFIGKRWTQTSSVFWFNGIIDDVRIYNRALSAGEVGQLYQEGL